MNTTENANSTRHYVLLTIAIIIGLVGVYFRFLGDSFMYTSISNVILVVGIILALKAVFTIMK
jgi:divalent metal cation (Fe/Co/Zn/Cd) transporter